MGHIGHFNFRLKVAFYGWLAEWAIFMVDGQQIAYSTFTVARPCESIFFIIGRDPGSRPLPFTAVHCMLFILPLVRLCRLRHDSARACPCLVSTICFNCMILTRLLLQVIRSTELLQNCIILGLKTVVLSMPEVISNACLSALIAA